MTTNSCHDNKRNSISASDSTTRIPGLTSPGSLSTYSIFELDTAIKPSKVSLIELANHLKTFNGEYIETEGTFRYGFENISILGNSPVNKFGVSFWLDINNSKLPFYQSFEEMAGKHIRIKGMLDITNQGHMNGYPAAITKIYFWEVTN